MTGLSDELNMLNTEGWSTREIERIAERHGHKLHYSTVSNYLAGRHPKPSARVLAAFAAVFGVDINRLREAAGQPSIGEPFELGPEFSRLTGPQRDAIRNVARLFLEQNDAVADQPVPDGATWDPDDTAHIPLPKSAFELAAKRGPSEGKRLKREADARGEESQDTGSDEPA